MGISIKMVRILEFGLEFSLHVRVARFFLVQTYQIGTNAPNDHKL
jgi:hypothetical protein